MIFLPSSLCATVFSYCNAILLSLAQIHFTHTHARAQTPHHMSLCTPRMAIPFVGAGGGRDTGGILAPQELYPLPPRSPPLASSCTSCLLALAGGEQKRFGSPKTPNTTKKELVNDFSALTPTSHTTRTNCYVPFKHISSFLDCVYLSMLLGSCVSLFLFMRGFILIATSFGFNPPFFH